MFNETSYDEGLGDAFQDCLATVRARSSDYVYNGATLTYTATVRVPGSILPSLTTIQAIANYFKDNDSRINNAIANRGYHNVRATTSTFGFGDGTLVVTAKQPIDQGSRDDVRGNFRGAVQALGLQVVNDNINVQNPSFEDICRGTAGSTGGSGGSVDNKPNPNPKPDEFEWPKWLRDFAASLGFSVPVALAIFGLGAMFIMKK